MSQQPTKTDSESAKSDEIAERLHEWRQARD
jgi:hypothetical protein